MNNPSEKEMREQKVPWFKSQDELVKFINGLVDRRHDYGTCVYAMSMAAQAAFNYVSGQLGVTGFQASCADLDFLRRTRRMEHGFCIIDYEKLLYPQHVYSNDWPTRRKVLDDNKEWLSEKAKENIRDAASGYGAHPNVISWWEDLVSANGGIDPATRGCLHAIHNRAEMRAKGLSRIN